MQKISKLNRILAIMTSLAILFMYIGMYYAIDNNKNDNLKEYLISPTQINDVGFRKAICENLGLKDRESINWGLTDADLSIIEATESLIISSDNIINNLSGIELFKDLKNLTIFNNNLTEIDISKNILLEDLHLGENKLNNLDVSKNVNLKVLKAYTNNLSNIDTSNNRELIELNIAKNKIKNIDVSKNLKLEIVSAHDNAFEKVNFGSINTLKEIRLFNNQLSHINIVASNPTILSVDNQNVFNELYLENGLYKTDMKKLVGTVNLENVEIVSTDNGINFNKSTGVVSFTSKPTSFSYKYNTHKNNENTTTYMQNINVNLIDVKSNVTVTYDPTNEGTINGNSNPITENVISGGKPANVPTPVPVNSDYQFIGWKKQGDIKKVITINDSDGATANVLLKNSGELYYSGYGKLVGIDSVGTHSNIWKQIPFENYGIKSIKDIFAANRGVFILSSDDKLYATGNNSRFGMGLPTDKIYFNYELVDTSAINSPIIDIVSGNTNHIILTQSGKIYGSGDNYQGELGSLPSGVIETFTEIPNPSGTAIKKIYGDSYSGSFGFLTQDNQYYVTGYNANGMLGIGNSNPVKGLTKVDIGEQISEIFFVSELGQTLIKTSNNKYFFAGYDYYDTLDCQSLSSVNIYTDITDKINQIIAGKFNIDEIYKLYIEDGSLFIINSSNELWAKGNDHSGKLGINLDKSGKLVQVDISSTLGIIDIVIGDRSTIILKNTGEILGAGGSNLIGFDLSNDTVVFKDCGKQFLGDKLFTNDELKQEIINQPVSFAAQYELIPEYTVTYDPTDKGTVTPESEIVKDGQKPILTTDAVPNQPDDYRFIGWKQQKNIKQVVLGGDGSVIILTNGNEIYVCGNNARGQLGLGDSINVDVFTKVTNLPKDVEIDKIVAGRWTTAFLTTNGDAYVTGDNKWKQLGLGASIEKVESFTKLNLSFKIKDLVLGEYHSALLTQTGEVYVVGTNSWGQLGLPLQSNAVEFTKVENLPTNIKQIAIGNMATGFLTNDDKVYLTGYNEQGNLGLGYVSKTVNEFSQAIDTPSDIEQLVLGGYHSGIVTKDKQIYMVGANSRGQLGFGNNENVNKFTKINLNYSIKPDKLALGWYNSGILTQDNKIYTTGDNKYSQLGFEGSAISSFTEVNLTTESKPIDLIMGQDNSVIITENKKGLICGSNQSGQLADSSFGVGNANNFINLNYPDLIDIVLTTEQVKEIQITENTTFVAQYEFIPKYTVTYDPTDKGTVTPESEIVKDGEKPTETNDAVPNQPNDYKFAGWKEKYKIKIIESYGNATILVTDDDKVYVSGLNSYGQLGLGNNYNLQVNSFTNVKLPEKIKIKDVIMNTNRITIISEDGQLYTTGLNSNMFFTFNVDVFTKVTLPNGIKVNQISQTGWNTIIVTESGEVYITGSNNYGQLGLGLSTSGVGLQEFTKVNLPNDVKAKQVITSSGRTVILTESNELYVAGNNESGQLGLGSQKQVTNFTKVPLSNDIKIKQFYINSSGNISVILTEDNSIYVTGDNRYGQLGLGHTNTVLTFTKIPISNLINIKEIIIGNSNIAILTEDNSAYIVGLNNLGQLGLGDNVNKNTFTKIPISNIKKIVLNGNHTTLLTEDNSIYVTGYNKFGQLGLGDNIDRNTFTKVEITGKFLKIIGIGSSRTFLLTQSGEIYATGENNYGQLGLGNNNNVNIFTKVEPDLELSDQLLSTEQIKQQVITGNKTFVAQYELIPKHTVTYDPTDKGTVNPESEIVKDGEKPIETNNAISNQPDNYKFNGWKEKNSILNLVAASSCNGILSESGKVYMVGRNNLGQLGLGDTTDVKTFTEVDLVGAGITSPVKQLSLSEYSSGMLTENNEVYMTGSNIYGELGLGHTNLVKTFTKVDLVGAGITSPVKQLILGLEFTGILTEDNEVYMVGRNNYGQLGLGHNNDVKTFTKVDLLGAGITSPVKQLSLSAYSSGMLTENDEIYMTGKNEFGQLGLGHNNAVKTFTKVDLLGAGITSPVKQLSLSAHSSGMLTENNEIYMTGKNEFGHLGLGHNNDVKTFTKVDLLGAGITSPVKQLSLGDFHSGILTENNEIYMIGRNEDGQLGLGNNTSVVNNFTKVDLIALGITSQIKELSLGFYHSGILTEDGKLYMTGFNYNGQLGLNDNIRRNKFTEANIDLGVKDQLLTTDDIKNMTITKNITFVAQYENLYSITFENGTIPSDQIIGELPENYVRLVDGTIVTLIPPANYSRPDYILKGWTTDENNQLVVEYNLDSQVTINGDHITLYPVFEKDTSTSISISMPLNLAFGNYSDKSTATSDYALSQSENRFHSAVYSIVNHSTFVGIGDGSVNVSITGIKQTGNQINLVEEESTLNSNTIYNENQMRVGLTLDGVDNPFVGTNISNDIQAKGDISHGLTKNRTAMFSSILNPSISNKNIILGTLPSAQLLYGNPLVPTIGQFKIVGDASNKFPKNNIRQNYEIIFKFERLPD